MVFPRGATATISRPVKLLFNVVQVAPPSVVFSSPVYEPPSKPSLLKVPTPATSVLLVASVGSNLSAPIESDPCWSVSGVQVGLAAVALVVFQIPPFTAATYTVLGSVG